MSDTQPNQLYPALLAAMKAFGPVKKDASNPAFRSKYATLQSVLETVEDALWANGLVLVQRLQYDRIAHNGSHAGEGTPILITEIIHAASGEKLESVVPVISKDPNDPQKVGGALTYYRRYSLLALLGLAPEDDDGNSAAKPAPSKAAQWRETIERPNVAVDPPRATSTSGTSATPLNVTPARPASPAAPPAAQEHPLLATIRDDTADPKKRETALHNYMMLAESLAELAAACTIAERASIPEATLDRARAWHNERIVTGKTPAPKKAAPAPAATPPAHRAG